MKSKKFLLNFTLIALSIFFLFLVNGCCPSKAVKKEEALVKKPEVSPEEMVALKKETEEKEEALKKELAAKEAALKEAAQKEAALKREMAEKEAALKKEVPILEKAKEEFKLEDIYFAFDDFSLTKESMDILGKMGAWLLANPGKKIQIEGHCDERGTNEYNMALGQRRADSAKNYLVTLGVEAKRISTISYGEEKPLDPGHNEKAWTKNRRAHFLVVEK